MECLALLLAPRGFRYNTHSPLTHIRRMHAPPMPPRRQTTRRCNSLEGKRWLQNSISVWGDIRKSLDEQRLKHPAMFPSQLVERLIESFLPAGPGLVLDPFCGTGSTLIAAARQGKRGVGLDISSEFLDLARARLQALSESDPATDAASMRLLQDSAFHLGQHVEPHSVDICVTSPPYWNILNQRRSADSKAARHYGNLECDLGTIDDYHEFLDALAEVFRHVFNALKQGSHCCVIVMDLRKAKQFFPFHSDLAERLKAVGFLWDDLVIWNRQTEYNNLRPLGYPAVFRVNKVHEFILLMQKPKALEGPR